MNVDEPMKHHRHRDKESKRRRGRQRKRWANRGGLVKPANRGRGRVST